MKTFNLIACIIVLLLAAVSAVFSYFLYEKRVQFVNGWNQMATAIETSAKTIDKKSEKKFAPSLSKAALEHKKYSASPDEFNNSLKNLDTQSKAIIAQYEGLENVIAEKDELIASLNNQILVAKQQIREMSNIFGEISGNCGTSLTATDKQNLLNPEAYQGVARKVRERVAEVVANRNAIASSLNSVDSEIKIDKNVLFRNPAQALAPIKNIVTRYRNRSITYGNTITTIGTAVGKRFIPDNRNDAIVNEINARQSRLAQRERELQARGEEINRLNGQINTLNGKINTLNGEVANLKRGLNIDPNAAVPKMFTRGSEEARKAIHGKVIEVSTEYGYVVVNIGTETTVTQTIGNKTHSINPEVKEQQTFRISRNGNIITTIKLREVGAKEATASIPLGKTSDIAIGDDVFYGTAE